MIKYIKMMAFSVFLSVSAYGHNIAGNNDTEIHMTKYDGIYTLQTYPSYNCRKFYADWYQIRQHIMSSQAIPIPFRSRENKCDKVLRNFYIGGNKAVKFCIRRNLVDRIISFNPHGRHIIPKKFKGKYITFKKHDHASTNIIEVYNKSSKFMLGAKKGLLVHCAKGHSRSVALCILFIMDRYNVSYRDAHRYLKIVRPTIGPKPWFVKQLKEVDDFYLNK